MVLALHAVVGGALGNASKASPFVAFIMGFLSHFILDSIPHWDYHLGSSTTHATGDKMKGDFVIDDRFAKDLIKIGFDCLLGFLLVFIFMYHDHLAVDKFLLSSAFWGAVGGVFPDFLQFVYYKTKRQPLTALQRFHLWIHAHTHLDDWMFLGPAIQVILIILVIWISVKF